MSDFVTLSCPSCGGKLTVQKNSPTYICDYCGTEHKLREEDIEFFGRCPKCHRNDRVEKITAIVNRHDQLAAKFPSPDQLNLDRFVERSDLSIKQRLNSFTSLPITESRYTQRSKGFFVVTGILLLLTFFLIGPGSEKDQLNSFFLFSLFGVFVFAFFGIYNLLKGEIKQRELEIEAQNTKAALKQELLTQQKEVDNQKSILISKLKARYDQIYYCHRDDLLFIPGELDHASCDDFEGYLTSVFETCFEA